MTPTTQSLESFGRITQGTSPFFELDATIYPELKNILLLDADGHTFCPAYVPFHGEGIIECFKQLKASPRKITSVLIGEGKINDRGAAAMADYIKETKDLQVLDFHNRNVSEKGLKMIIEALKTNKSIVQINLRSNDVTPAIGEELLDLVQHHNHAIRQMGIVQRASYPDQPKPSPMLERAIHQQIIANATAALAKEVKEISTQSTTATVEHLSGGAARDDENAIDSHQEEGISCSIL